jgi:dihydroxy-acid dehydratase
MPKIKPEDLRSREWFNNPADPENSAIYIERYLNFGLTPQELQSGKPIIAIAQTGSDLSPCNRHHLELAKRVRDGITAAGGTALEVPVHPIQETGRRPTALLDRNLAYLGLVESLYGYPIDGVVLMIGCDKTTPACLMAAATVNIPAIALSVGPMLNGWHDGKRAGSGTLIWKAREMLASGEIDDAEFMEMATASAPSVGYCNTMGTASTMNSLAEALGMQLPGAAAIPAPYRERGQIAYETGLKAVEMVWNDTRPTDIMTREAFENAVVVNSALGGSTNAPIHLNAIARHLGVPLDNDDWQALGHKIPLLANMQPAGEYLGEDYHQAGGVPAVVNRLLEGGILPHPGAMTINGQTIGENCQDRVATNDDVIRPLDRALKAEAGFINLKGNLFESAIIKTSVISPAFQAAYLNNPEDPNAFEGTACVFDGPEEYISRIDDPSEGLDANTILVMRGAGPKGYPGAAEVVNMRPPIYLMKQGVEALPCIGDGRQSGTSGSPSILNAAPEAADNAGLAILKTGDRIRIDLNTGSANILISDEEFSARQQALIAAGGYPVPDSQTPWQALFRDQIEPLDRGMILREADTFQDVARKSLPRNNH